MVPPKPSSNGQSRIFWKSIMRSIIATLNNEFYLRRAMPALPCSLPCPFGRGRLFRLALGKKLPDWAAEIDCTSWGQFFLKYLLGNPVVTAVIPGTDKPEHIVDNLGAGHGRLPDAAIAYPYGAICKILG